MPTKPKKLTKPSIGPALYAALRARGACHEGAAPYAKCRTARAAMTLFKKSDQPYWIFVTVFGDAYHTIYSLRPDKGSYKRRNECFSHFRCCVESLDPNKLVDLITGPVKK